ncbi:hypothetical protein [Anaerococcus porci]|uniref:hypothetical protein n=1 Tax=Anaerococcus porci TaxID=2652269 RepID=UPI002A747785|nr:hypothetical protein [Anaerococcus porci]MDY3007089.1 hypothetical protein [Anaerococcus porci]
MNLRKFFNKNIKITFFDGEFLTGYVETYTPYYDSIENEEEIAILTLDKKGPLIGINASEIKDIELLD